ncbi:S-layer homology domain-containing protein [Salibacterium aidingense]|uniref:S-layer homology domain-containing protein n=1 Tax=Salibacterium aidingense TaxID=384933 RepID=UPI000412088B|nr:S-layer homology domain-containing protein [Salibacterium aidingense]
MKKRKALLFSLTAVGIWFAVPEKEMEAAFSDVNKDFWAEESIEYLNEEGIIGGYPDGTFRPGESITRIQAASMMVKALNLETTGRSAPDYEDISVGYARSGIVAAVNEEGIMSGNGNQFRPGEKITRAQMAAVLRRGFELGEYSEILFTDIDRSYWSFTDITTIAYHGITTGYEDGTFRPGNETTRAQFAVFLDNVMNLGENSAGNYDGIYPLQGGEVSRNGWTYTIRNHELVRYTEEEEEKEVILSDEEVTGDYFHDGGDWDANDADGLTEGTPLTIKGDWIYYTIHYRTGTHSGNKNFHLYRVRTDGTEKEQILNEPVDHYYIADRHIYYIGYEDHREMQDSYWKRARLDGSARTKLTSLQPEERQYYFDKHANNKYALEADGDSVYYSTESAIFQMNLNGQKQQRLINVPGRDMLLHKRSLYAGSYRGFYKISPDGSGHEQLSDEPVLDIAEIGDCLIVLTENKVYSYEEETSELKIVDELPVPATDFSRRDVALERTTGNNALLYFVNSNGKDPFYLIQEGEVTSSITMEEGFFQNVLAKERGNYYFTFGAESEGMIYKAEGSTKQWKSLGTIRDDLLHLYQDDTFIAVGKTKADEPNLTIIADAVNQEPKTFEVSLPLVSARRIEGLEKDGQIITFQLLGAEETEQQMRDRYEITFDLASGELMKMEKRE